jgi:ribosomal protein S12 methylthiotransferase accessory factor
MGKQAVRGDSIRVAPIQTTSSINTFVLSGPTIYTFEDAIGPLAIPGRRGCGYCAWQRMLAAAVVNPPGARSGFNRQSLAREIRRIDRSGIDGSPLLDQVLIGRTFHRFVPLPECPVCGGASARSQPVHLSADDPPEHVLDALAGLLDPRTGIIARINVEHQIPIVVTAAPPHVFNGDGSLRQLPVGWGKGLTLSGAILSGVGEAIERYSASLPDVSRINWVRFEELDGDVLDPREFALYTDDQYDGEGFSYVRFDPSVRHPWIRGHWFQNERPVWVHAVFGFLSLTLHKEHLICQGTSNGLAAGSSMADAAMRATMELVERDAFLAAWLTGRPGRRVNLQNEPDLQEVIAGLEALGATVEIYILDTSAFGSTALCLAFGDGQAYPGVTLGLGCDLEPRLAIRQAVLELGQTGPYLRRLMQSNAVTTPASPAGVKTMLDHAAYYFPAERARAFDRLRGNERPPLPRQSSDLRIAIVDVTSRDVATGPFRVARAVSPDLQAISYGHGLERAVVKRIRDMGLAADVPDIHPIW